MSLKNYILLLTFLLLTINLNAESSRQNDVMLTFDKSSEKITKAIGWKKNTSIGKWIKNQNCISKDNRPWRAQSNQNFIWMQMHTLKYQNESFYIFTYEREAGTYNYPNIQADWVSYKQTRFKIFTLEQYNKMKENIKHKSNQTLKITSSLGGYMNSRFQSLGGEHAYSQENLLSKITKSIKSNELDYMKCKECFFLNSLIDDNKDVVRFKLPSSCYYNKGIEKEYFEINLLEFQKLFIF